MLNRTEIRTGDRKFKKHIVNTESKIKSIWQPTVICLTPSSIKEGTLQTPHSRQKTTTSAAPESKVEYVPFESSSPIKTVTTSSSQSPKMTHNYQISSSNPVQKSTCESASTNQHRLNENDSDTQNLFENDLQISARSKNQESSHTGQTPTPQQQRKPLIEPRRFYFTLLIL